MDLNVVNGIAGIAALVNSLLMVPSVMALRRIANSHESRITKLETVKVKRKRRRL